MFKSVLIPLKLSSLVFIRQQLRQISHNNGINCFTSINATDLQASYVIPLRYRAYLPGADKHTFPKYLQGPRNGFPYSLNAALETNSSYRLEDWSRACREQIDILLPIHGAVLFRNLPLSSALEFEKFFMDIGYTRMGYVGGNAYREKVEQQIYSASNEPPDVSIDLHNEMAYTPVYNKKIFFYCLTPPNNGQGGETPICATNDILNNLDVKFIKKIKKKNVRYIRNSDSAKTSNYMTWQSCFETKSKEVAEKIMKEKGFEWKWLDNDSLRFWHIQSAFITDPKSKEKIWFNQIHAHHASYYKAHPNFTGLNISDDSYPLHATYGDGEELEPEYAQQIRELGWSNAVGFQWRTGDVLVLDNLKVQHARLSFKGKRKILAALTAD